MVAFKSHITHGIVQMRKGEDLAKRLQPTREIIDGKKSARKQELRQCDEIRQWGDGAFAFSQSADHKTKTHENKQSQETEGQQFKKREPPMNQGEVERKMPHAQDHNGGDHLEGDPAQRLPEQNMRTLNGGGEESLQHERLAQIIKNEGNAKHSGAQQ